MSEQWVVRWRLQVSPEAVLPGIWRLRQGGFVAHAQVPDPTRLHVPGKRRHYKTVFAVLRDVETAKDALDWLEAEKKRAADPNLNPIPTWKDFALALFERKVATGDLQSASGIASFKDTIDNIIRTAAWASLRVTDVRHRQIHDWRDALPTCTWKRVAKSKKTGAFHTTTTGTYGPRTMNKMLVVARLVWKAAVVRFELARNPMDGITGFSTKTAKTYSKEQPNALNPRTEIADFLARVKHRFPQWYCFILMGFVLGQRPSTLRPLRRKGPYADIDLVAKKLYIRRSNSLGQAIMDTTKTGNELELCLPDELVEVITEHIAMLNMRPVTRESEFLFPSPFSGRMISKAALNRPFIEIAKEMRLTKHLSPRSMRRTYQDLADEAKLRAVTAMAVSGHRTIRMKHLYSTAHDDEVREGISKVIGLATAKSGASDGANHEKAS